MRQNLKLLAIKRRLWLVYEGGHFTCRGVTLIDGARLSSGIMRIQFFFSLLQS